MLGWVIRFLLYLPMLGQHWVSANAKKHEGRAIHLLIDFLAVLDWVTRFLWHLARAAQRKFCFCNPSARSAEKNFASDEFAENTMVERRKACKKYFSVFFYENPIPKATFFLYVKLLISLLNGALFRLGENFSVRGHGAKNLQTTQW